LRQEPNAVSEPIDEPGPIAEPQTPVPVPEPQPPVAVAEPQPPVPFEAEAEPLPAGETVYFGREETSAPAESPLPTSTFELRDWLASELDTEVEPDAEGEDADSASHLEQLTWTDPGPGANPPAEPESDSASGGAEPSTDR